MERSTVVLLFMLVYPLKISCTVCYYNKFTYNNNECLKDTTDDNEMIEKVIQGKICKEVSCTPFIPSIKANICIIKEKNSFNFVIIQNGTNSMYRFNTFESEKFNVTKITKIAVRENWITSLLEYDEKEAYRLSFILSRLSKIKSNDGNLEYMEKLKNIVWEPSLQNDKYLILNSTEIRQRMWCFPSGICSTNEKEHIDLPHDRCIDVNEIRSSSSESYMEKHKETEILLLVAFISIGSLILALLIAISVIACLLKRNTHKSLKSDIYLKGQLLQNEPLFREEELPEDNPSHGIKVAVEQNIPSALRPRQENLIQYIDFASLKHGNQRHNFQTATHLYTINEEEASAKQGETSPKPPRVSN